MFNFFHMKLEFLPHLASQTLDVRVARLLSRRDALSHATMPSERVDGAPALDYIEPIDVLNLLSMPKFLIIDCRRILRTGLLPNTAVFRRRGEETLEKAMGRIIEDVMFTNPPEDQSRALIVDYNGAGAGVEAEDMAGVAAYLSARVGCSQCMRIQGGAHALMASHRFLFSLSKEAAANLPSKLSSRLFIGSTASAIDPKMLDGLGITHVVSVLRRQLQLEHVPRERHLVLHVGATQCEGTSGVRHLLKMALPFLVEVLSGADDVRRVLIHSDDGKGAGATALACAALLADSAGQMDLDGVIGHLAQCRPAAPLPAPTVQQLREVEAWLLDGVNDGVPIPGADDVDEDCMPPKCAHAPSCDKTQAMSIGPPPPLPLPPAPLAPPADEDEEDDDGDFAG